MPRPAPSHVFDKGVHDGLDGNPRHYGPSAWTVPASRVSPLSTRHTDEKMDSLAGLTKEENKSLKRVQHRANQLDNAFEFCGMMIGWSSVIAMVPGIGDMLDMLLALMVIRMASEFHLPASVKLRMLCNVAFDFLIGLLPVIGDLLDISFKANSRNAKLLESHLEKRAKERARDRSIQNDGGLAKPSGSFPRYPDDARSYYPLGILNDVEAQGPFPANRGWMSADENIARQQTSKR